MAKKKHPRTFRFGKYKGQPVNAVITSDPSYIKWMHETFKPSPFTDKELRHLNYVWRHRFGNNAVLAEELAEQVVYQGCQPSIARTRLGNIRATDLRHICRKEPEYAKVARLIIDRRNARRAARVLLHRPAPYFQSDDIPL